MSIYNYLYNMRGLMQIDRYQNKFRFKPRTAAEHQWAVSKIAQGLTLWNNKISEEKADMGDVLVRSILNGTVKLFTGEIQSNTKNASKKMTNAVKEVNEIIYDTKYAELLPESWDALFKDKVLEAKDSFSVEGKIVNAASIINVILEAYEEIELGNARYFTEIFYENIMKLTAVDLDIVRWFLSMPITELLDMIPEKNFVGSEGYKLSAHTRLYVVNNFERPTSEDAAEFQHTFFNYIYEIRGMMSIKRYQNIYRNKKRTVAEHEWSVSLISLCLGLLEKEKSGAVVDFSELLQTTLSHDDIELFSGDILSHTKRTTKKISQAVEKMELSLFEEKFLPMLPKDWEPAFTKYVLFPKDNTIEGQIMSAADIIDTIFESEEEIQLGNKTEFEGVLFKAKAKLMPLNLISTEEFK